MANQDEDRDWGLAFNRTIKEWQEAVHANAVRHGWYEENRQVPELLCLIHSEVSEALEAYRHREDAGFREELADVAIRLLDACEYWRVDLEEEMRKKHDKNIKRSYRHGGKRC